MVLNQDFKEFIQSLNDNRVRYLVVGGYAVALHGHPRYTKDMDVWLEMSQENAANVVKALEHFGFGSLGLQAADFLVPDQIIQLGYPPGRIDMLTTLPGVDFASCYASRVQVDVDGVLAFILCLLSPSSWPGTQASLRRNSSRARNVRATVSGLWERIERNAAGRNHLSAVQDTSAPDPILTALDGPAADQVNLSLEQRLQLLCHFHVVFHSPKKEHGLPG